MNAGSAEGLRAWQLLVERHDPHFRSRTAGQLLCLLQFDFSGDVLAKLEAYERDLALYEEASGEKDLRWLVVEFREIPDVGPLLTRACGCLGCEGGSVGNLPDASWSQRPKHSTDGDRRATAAR